MIEPLNPNWDEEIAKLKYSAIQHAFHGALGGEFMSVLEELCYENKSTLPMASDGKYDPIGQARNEGMRVVLLWLKDRLKEIENGVLNK